MRGLMLVVFSLPSPYSSVVYLKISYIFCFQSCAL